MILEMALLAYSWFNVINDKISECHDQSTDLDIHVIVQSTSIGDWRGERRNKCEECLVF